MKYAKRSKHNLHRIFKIQYMSLTGAHSEYVKCESATKAIEYGKKEAAQCGAEVIDVKLSSLPKNLNNDESFVDLA